MTLKINLQPIISTDTVQVSHLNDMTTQFLKQFLRDPIHHLVYST